MDDGVYFDLPHEQYLAEPRLSASGIKLMLQSPLDFYVRSWFAGADRVIDPPSDAMTLGTAFHRRIVEGRDAFYATYVAKFDASAYPDALQGMEDLRDACRLRGFKVGGNKADLIERLTADHDLQIIEVLEAEYEGRHRGKTLLYPDTIKRIEIAAAMIEKHPDLRKAFIGGRPEVSILYTDAESGVKMKARLDYLKPRAIVDLKSFSNPYGKPIDSAVITAFAGGRYQIQAAVYDEAVNYASEMSDGTDLLLAARDRDFFFCFVATGPAPVSVGYRFPKGTMYEIGKMQMRNGIALYKQYSETFGTDPWVDTRPIKEFDDLSFPQYAMEGA